MSPFVVPQNLRAFASPDRSDWLATLPGLVADLADEWSLRLGEPFQPGGNVSWVAPARDRDGRDVVLKVSWRHTEAEHEADALALWDGDGAVAVHAARKYDHTSALLLERCLPGVPLARLEPGPRQDIVVAGLLARLWREPPRTHPYRSLAVMCADWVAEFEHDLADAPVIDPGLARAGMDLFMTLPATPDREVVLCTDLHAHNILAARREPWLVIDPKPHVGDPTYDVLQHLLNCPDRLVADPIGLIERLAEPLGLDPDRLTLWLFARCVMESLDNPVLRRVARLLAPA